MSKKGPRQKNIESGLTYKEILARKAEQGDKRAKQTLKELGTRAMFDNYSG